MKTKMLILLFVVGVAVSAGCQFPKTSDNTMIVPTPLDEPSWIRNGEPIQFEGENWYPTHEIERFMDNELYPAGVYRDVQFFLDRAEVKPFERLYTRFAKGRYRAFEKRE